MQILYDLNLSPFWSFALKIANFSHLVFFFNVLLEKWSTEGGIWINHVIATKSKYLLLIGRGLSIKIFFCYVKKMYLSPEWSGLHEEKISSF